MEIHIFIWSTMSPEMTRDNLYLHGIEFDPTNAGTIQRFKWPRKGPMSVSLWITCHHPISFELSNSIIPYMDACVCWYHDHDAMSCIRVDAAMKLIEQFSSTISLMTTTTPQVDFSHKSKVRKYYDDMGFERRRMTQSLPDCIEVFVANHLQFHKHLVKQ